MNVGGSNFLDISFLTGADGDGDGRSVVAGDFRNIGKLDLILRQTGGGPLILYQNNFPQKHYLKISLRGQKSNRLGVDARLIASVKGQPIVRELYPFNSYRSQMPSIVHFGLGDAASAVHRAPVRSRQCAVVTFVQPLRIVRQPLANVIAGLA